MNAGANRICTGFTTGHCTTQYDDGRIICCESYIHTKLVITVAAGSKYSKESTKFKAAVQY